MKIGTQVQFLTDKSDTVIGYVEPIECVPNSLQEFLDTRCAVTPCGSRVTCDPPPTDTDQDYLVFTVSEHIPALVDWLTGEGFRWEGDSEHYKDAAANGFMSWRKGDVNYIVTANVGFQQRHRRATMVCKRLNLMNKKDRIAVFEAVLYGK